MALGRLIYLVVVSGIFSKNNGDIDILPPPPPFPEIGKESWEAEEVGKIREQKEKQKQKEIEPKRKEDEKEKLGKEKKRVSGKNVLDLFRGLGLVKTGEKKKAKGTGKIEYQLEKEIKNKLEPEVKHHCEICNKEMWIKKEEKELEEKKAKGARSVNGLEEEKEIKKELESEVKYHCEICNREIRSKKKEKELEEKKKLEVQRRKDKLKKEKMEARKKGVFEFFHGLGLVKTDKEKEEYTRQKQKEIRQIELEKKRKEEERRRFEEERIKRMQEEDRKRKLEGERQREKQRWKELELKRKEEKRKEKQRVQLETQKLKDERKRAEEGKRKRKLEERRQRKLEGERIAMGRRKAEIEKEEVEDLEKISPRPVKEERAKKAKLEMPELISLKTEKFEREAAKPEEVANAEEEIQKAISEMQKTKMPSIVRGLFKKEKKQAPVEERIETPEVMPRTYDKIDYVELIEEKMHKARLALMDFKFEVAKMAYLEVMKAYNELEPKEKSKVYQDIKDLYYERKSAEKFMK